jgi:hypothetical protein
MWKPFFGRAVVAASLFLAGLAAPAAADWLVTRDGGRVETRGPWKVKGKLVVFTRAEGQLASLRITDVDWAASERATAQAAEAAQKPPEGQSAPPEPHKESRWVLTDANFQQAAPPPPAAEKSAEPAAAATDAVGRPRVAVVLEGWERKDRPDGLEIAGTLRNPGTEIAAEIGVTVRLYDETGALVATGEGRIGTPALGAGEAAAFRASFPGVFTYAEAKFDVRGYGLRIKAVEEGVTPGTAEPPPDRAP